MSAVVVDIADAVAALLASTGLSLPFTVERAWLDIEPRSLLDDSDPVAVVVIPGMLTVAAFDLAPRIAASWEILVSIVRACQPTNEATDPLAGFTEEVAFLLAAHRLLGTSEGRVAQCTGVEARPAHDPEQLLVQKMYRAIISVTYRVTK